jgi:hypothetical protein
MRYSRLVHIMLILALVSTAAEAQNRYNHIHNPPEPIFHQINFLNIHGIPEMNLDFALAWTDSAAGLFLQPYDAAILHVNVDGDLHDVFVFSDAGMDRLCIWMCTQPDANGYRLPETITAYYGEDCRYLSAPSGITTNAKNRVFDPENDLIYLADRGNDRILELAYIPDRDGGHILFNRSIGDGELEWPTDVSLCSYGGDDPASTDIFIVQWGHKKNEGKLLRFNLDGRLRGDWSEIPDFIGDPVIPLSKPVSIECFPDTLRGYEAIYISEANQSKIFCYSVSIDTDPELKMLHDLEINSHFWQSGGVMCDDYGRIYICNYSAGFIQLWEPKLGYPYPSFSRENSRCPDTLEYPASIIFDSYYSHPEAIVIEKFGRTTGIKTFVIEGAALLSKPPLGFSGGNLVHPMMKTNANLPLKYTLYNAYPNPFNSDCRILFDIPEKTHVLLEVYNVLGQKIATLIDDIKEPRLYSVIFDASQLSSGTYFYSLKTANYSQTRSVVLIK